MAFSDSFFIALNDWQNGWKGDLERKSEIADVLKTECLYIDEKYKKVESDCYRKKFLYYGELITIITGEGMEEGFSSWTTNIEFAKAFKGMTWPNAVTGAIFKLNPKLSEVKLNLETLWNCQAFQKDLDIFKVRFPQNCKAILNFKNFQKEVILDNPLKGSDIIALIGKVKSVDSILDISEVPLEERETYLVRLEDNDYYDGKLRYILSEKAQRVVKNLRIGILKKRVGIDHVYDKNL